VILTRSLVAAAAALLTLGTLSAQTRPPTPTSVPVATLLRADPLTLPGAVDSNSPVVWDLYDGRPELYVVTSIAGRPSRANGGEISQLGDPEPVEIEPWPTGGNWMEAVIRDSVGTWYGFYHNENNAEMCEQQPWKTYPRIGAARSTDQGATWTDLGIILEAAPETFACDTSNEYFVGGVGDFSALLDADQRDVYIYFSQYGREKEDQGVAVARVAWADLDDPVGKVTIWNDGVWLPPMSFEDESGQVHWEYPHATAIQPTTKPWHTGQEGNAFWGPSIHWNDSLQQYVMLLNRTVGDSFGQEGVYVAFNPRLDEPMGWSTPYKIVDGGGWYPQVVGLEEAHGTDAWASRIARFFMSGRSESLIEFSSAPNDSAAQRRR
jgi:hypothetical protein